VCSSYVQCGTLAEASHLPAYCMRDQQQSDTTSALPVLTTTSSLLTGLSQCSADGVTVAVFSASLAGSWQDADADVADVVELSSDVDVDKFIIDCLLTAVQTVIDCGTGVLACQKVNLIPVFFLLLSIFSWFLMLMCFYTVALPHWVSQLLSILCLSTLFLFFGLLYTGTHVFVCLKG